MSWPDRAVGSLADGQQGQVTHDQLVELGVGQSMISYSLVRGRIYETFGRVYAVGHRALPPLWREMGAVLACGEDAHVSRRSAAGAWGFRLPHPGDVEVTVPYGRNARRAGIRIHRCRNIDTAEVRRHEGVPISSPALTLLEIAADLTYVEFERAFDDALTSRVMKLGEAVRLLEKSEGCHGATRFAELARPEHELQMTASDTEQRMKALVRRGGLSTPVVNMRNGRYFPDFRWHRERVLVEVDGYRFHGTRRAFEGDRARDAEMAAAGWVVLRFTWRQLRFEPDVVLVRLAQVLALRAAARQ
jgi:very-short-patch-repair endonuclease